MFWGGKRDFGVDELVRNAVIRYNKNNIARIDIS